MADGQSNANTSSWILKRFYKHVMPLNELLAKNCFGWENYELLDAFLARTFVCSSKCIKLEPYDGGERNPWTAFEHWDILNRFRDEYYFVPYEQVRTYLQQVMGSWNDLTAVIGETNVRYLLQKDFAIFEYVDCNTFVQRLG